MRHGDDDILLMVVAANLEGIQKFGKEFDLCPDCFYMTLIANLAFRLMTKLDYSEDEFMTEIQKMVSSFREGGQIDERVLH